MTLINLLQTPSWGNPKEKCCECFLSLFAFVKRWELCYHLSRDEVTRDARGLVIVAFNPSVPQKVYLSACPWTIKFTQQHWSYAPINFKPLMLCTYQLSKSPPLGTKIMVRSMVYLSSALCKWMINRIMSPPWGDWGHTSQSNSWGAARPTLGLDIDRCITTKKKSSILL